MAFSQVSRRGWLAGFGLFVACVVLGAGAAQTPLRAQAAPAVRGELVYIGMHGGKIHAARFDPRSGDLTALGPVADNLRPTWGVVHPTLPVIYFNEESGNDGKSQGGVQALRIDRQSGSVTKISDVRAGGGGTTNLWFDRASNTILAVNYGGGSLVTMPVNADGTLGAIISQVQFTGSGPLRRQSSPHPHGVMVDPSGHYVLVSDLGADRIWVLPFDRKTRAIGADDPAQSRHFVLAPGSGPRHMAWHPGGRWLYLANELTANVDTFAWDARAGRLRRVQELSTDDPAYKGEKSAAEVAVSRDGRFVYVSNRGDHMIVVHAVNQRTGALTQIQRIASGGPWPWHFAIHRSGRWMLVANRDADAITVLAINPRTGLVRATGKSMATPKPVFVGLTSLRN